MYFTSKKKERRKKCDLILESPSSIYCRTTKRTFCQFSTMVVADLYHFVTIDEVSVVLLPEEEIEDFLPFGYLHSPSSFLLYAPGG